MRINELKIKLENIQDPRRTSDGNIRHKLEDIIAILIFIPLRHRFLMVMTTILIFLYYILICKQTQCASGTFQGNRLQKSPLNTL